MKLFELRKISLTKQYIICIGIMLMVILICFLLKDWYNHKIVSLILLMTISVIAMLFEIFPVLITAAISAILWNFLFIPPLFTFHIYDTQDLLMFMLYFVIALVNTVLTFKIRIAEKKSRDKEEKEKEIKLYNTLLNSLSHELRTPISTILGSVDTLKENKDSLSEMSKSELFKEIELASLRLNRQVENLLNMSRLESGMLKPKRDWYDINEFIYSIIEKIQKDHQIKIKYEADEKLPLFWLDIGLIEHVFNNILHNAIHYTPSDTVIEIKVFNQNSEIIIEISDNGNGFPESEIPLVFDKFYRLSNTKAGGSGLGLSIVKGFVEALHGTVKLFNNEKGGATFTIQIETKTSFINNLKNE